MFLNELSPTKRATYALATAELRRRFPSPNHEATRLDMRNRAIAEMNNLTQGTRTSEEYAEYVQELYTRLGEEYEVSLATRFVDGINNEVIQIQVDGHLRGVYTPFSEVIQVYLGCTTTLRRKEAATVKEMSVGVKETNAEVRKADPGPMMEYEQMMRQMGEMFKSFTLGIQNLSQNQRQQQPQPSSGAYQPSVGTVGAHPTHSTSHAG